MEKTPEFEADHKRDPRNPPSKAERATEKKLHEAAPDKESDEHADA